jgi:hypothetical protein
MLTNWIITQQGAEIPLWNWNFDIISGVYYVQQHIEKLAKSKMMIFQYSC